MHPIYIAGMWGRAGSGTPTLFSSEATGSNCRIDSHKYNESKHAVLGMTKGESLDYDARGPWYMGKLCLAWTNRYRPSNLGSAIPEEIRSMFLTPVGENTSMTRSGTPTEVPIVFCFFAAV